VVDVLKEPQIKDGLHYIRSWYVDGIINPDANVLATPPMQQPFFIGQGWPSAASIWAASNGLEKMVVGQAYGPIYSTTSIRGSLTCISANSRYKAETLKLLELANTDHKFRDMLAYGIEGKHFAYVKPNVVRKLTDTWNLYAYQTGTFFNLSTVEGTSETQ
jgi:putative aldouronate transport system substrate-binding protein